MTRFCRPRPLAHSRAGFTLLEVIIALSIATVLSFSIWTIAHTVGVRQVQTFRQEDVGKAVSSINYTLREALGGAGSGMIRAANLGAVHVKTDRSGTVPRDTLYVLQGDSATFDNASRACESGGAGCMVLVGDQRQAFSRGDLILTGSSSISARLYQVTAAPRLFSAPCGADCGETVYCPISSDDASNPLGRIIEVIAADRGSGVVSGQTCGQPYSPAGSCVEQITTQPFRRQYATCYPQSASGSNSVAFTELQVADRTGSTFGYPLGPVHLTVSGGAATPKIRTQRVRATRLWVRNAGSANGFLVRQSELREDGRWGAEIPVAGPVFAFQVESLHAGESSWTAGVGVSEAMLARTSPNRIARSIPAADAPPAYEYSKGYYTVAAVRVLFVTLQTQRDGTLRQNRHWIVANTTAELDAGSAGTF